MSFYTAWLRLRSPSKIALLALLLTAASIAKLRAQAPPNDNFTNRTALTGANIALWASSIGATVEPGEPDHWGRIGGSSVWWTWRASADGSVQISTDGSTNTEGKILDTVLAVYVGSDLTNLSLLAGNDDHDGLLTSVARFQVTQGTDYQIVVDGVNGVAGGIALALSFTTAPVSRPPNDNFANRILLSGSLVTASGLSIGATRELGEPVHAGEYGGVSVWWSWTAPASGKVKITLAGSDYDDLLAVYTGSALSNLTEVAGNDDEVPGLVLTAAVTFDAVAGQTYQIAVDGFDDATGHILLHIGPAGLWLTDPMRLADGRFQFNILDVPGKTNEVQTSHDFSAWTPLATNLNTQGI